MFLVDISDIIIISLDFEGYALQCNRQHPGNQSVGVPSQRQRPEPTRKAASPPAKAKKSPGKQQDKGREPAKKENARAEDEYEDDFEETQEFVSSFEEDSKFVLLKMWKNI